MRGIALLGLCVSIVLGASSCRGPSQEVTPTDSGAVDRPSSAAEPASQDAARRAPPAKELAMVPPSHKLDKSELDRKMEEWQRLHAEDEPEEGLEASDATPTAPVMAQGSKVLGPAGPRSVYSLLSLLTGGSDFEARGDGDKGVVTGRCQGSSVEFTYTASGGGTPGPPLALPGAPASRSRFTIEGTLPENVVRRWAAAGGGSPPSRIPGSERRVAIDIEAVTLRGSQKRTSERIEETGGAALVRVPYDDPGTTVYQDAHDRHRLIWVQGTPGAETTQVTLVTITALPRPLDSTLAVLADD